MTTTESELLVNLDTMFLLVMGMIVYLMQGGFAFLEAGSVRSKNTSNILIKNLLDSFVAGISYWVVGYPLAFGDGNAFIGWQNWASHDLRNDQLAFWFFQFVFAATAATIVSGALAERCEFVAYFVYSSILTAFIYPVVTHWAWHQDGWLTVGDEYMIDNVTVSVGYQDFAGSGVVHCVGGAAAFVGAALMGPRLGRFHDVEGKVTVVPLRGHSVPFAALGGFILLFGFMAFNGGSQTSISNPGDGAVVSLAVVNTVISGSMSAFTTLLFVRSGLGTHKWSLLSTINGALAGMVAICAGCNVIRPWGACCVGVIAGLTMNFVSWAMVKMKIDDPLDAVAVHLGGGIWGCLSVALLRYDETSSNGLLIDWDKEGALMLAWQLAGVVSIISWTSALCFAMFGLLKVVGKLRVDPELEKKGLDIPKHGEPAYPLESYGHGYLERIITILENGQLGTTALGTRTTPFTSAWAHYDHSSPQYDHTSPNYDHSSPHYDHSSHHYETADAHARNFIAMARTNRGEGFDVTDVPEMTERKDVTFMVDPLLQGEGRHRLLEELFHAQSEGTGSSGFSEVNDDSGVTGDIHRGPGHHHSVTEFKDLSEFKGYSEFSEGLGHGQDNVGYDASCEDVNNLIENRDDDDADDDDDDLVQNTYL